MASASDVAIANMALGHLGREDIESFTEKSAPAAAVRTFYDIARKQALETHDWSFARRRQTLAVHADAAPIGAWNYRYVYPSDCLALRYIQNPSGYLSLIYPVDTYAQLTTDAVPFEMEMSLDGTQKTILSDLTGAVAVYTFDQQDMSVSTNFFQELLSHLLAAKMAIKLTGKRALKGDEIKTYMDLVRIAPSMDANEGLARAPREAESIRLR